MRRAAPVTRTTPPCMLYSPALWERNLMSVAEPSTMPPSADSGLPPPPPEALAHSSELAELIAERITRAGDWIPFSEYMQMALYEPRLGYYAAGARKFGEAGDFVTAPEI